MSDRALTATTAIAITAIAITATTAIAITAITAGRTP